MDVGGIGKEQKRLYYVRQILLLPLYWEIHCNLSSGNIQ